MQDFSYDAIIVLGGGRTNNGDLTDLSKQRLDRGVELFQLGAAPLVFALGGNKSTYSPRAITFPQTGANVRGEYLYEHGVPRENIVPIPHGRDTILEAFVSRNIVRELGFNRILLVTSDKHMERSLYIFRRIFGNKVRIDGSEVPCGDSLIKEEEEEYLRWAKVLFQYLPEEIPDPASEDVWFFEHTDYYRYYKTIHDRYHPAGKESQAYMGVERS